MIGALLGYKKENVLLWKEPFTRRSKGYLKELG